MTTEQKNKVIAEFMGWNDLKYHKSWEWLMAVVDQIELLGNDYEVQIGRNQYRLNSYEVYIRDAGNSFSFEIEEETRIAAVHEAVFQFCQWHLNQKNLVS